MLVSRVASYGLLTGVLMLSASAPRAQQAISVIPARDTARPLAGAELSIDAACVPCAGVAGSGGPQVVEVLLPDTPRPTLVEFRTRPLLDRRGPGLAAGITSDQGRFLEDLSRIAALTQSATPSRVRRRFTRLFNGVALVADGAVRAELARLPYVLAVHDDVEMRATLAQSVPLIGAPTVWTTYGATGVGVKVAVLDTGIDYRHPDLGGCFGSGCRVAGGYDFVNNDGDPLDDHGHGTHVAGIVGANGAVKGVAPGVTLLAYKVLGSGGSGSTSGIIAALERAVADGAAVANLSLGGGGGPDDPMAQAVDNADAAGMLCVVSAGNSGSGYQTVGSPGVARSALTVGATDKSDQIASYSSRGPVDLGGGAFLNKPDMVAPGSDITSTIMGGGYGPMSGTSMAAPHVAGAAALVRQAHPAWTPTQMKSALTQWAKPLDLDSSTQGSGRLDVASSFAGNALFEVTHVSFGLMEGSAPITRQRDVPLRNPGTSSRAYALSVAGTPPAGATFTVSPTSVTLAGGAASTVQVTLTVDPSVTPDQTDWPFSYEVRLRADVVSGAAGAPMAAAQTGGLPLVFHKAAAVDLAFDPGLILLGFYNPSTDSRREITAMPTSPAVQMLPPGQWDVFATWQTWETSKWIYHSVVVPGVTVPGTASVELRKSQATVPVTLAPTDEQHNVLAEPLDVAAIVSYGRFGVSPARSYGTITVPKGSDVLFSPLSAPLGVGVGALAYARTPNRLYGYTWWSTGLAAAQTIPKSDAAFRRLASDYVPPLQADARWYRGVSFVGSGTG